MIDVLQKEKTMFDVIIVALLVFVAVVGSPRKQSEGERTDNRLQLQTSK